MSASLSGVFNLQDFTDAGLPLLLGRLYTYAPSTTTLKVAYTDAAASVPHTYTNDGLGGQYIALDARGEIPAPLFLTFGGYDIALKRADGTTVWTRAAAGQADSSAALSTDLANRVDAAKGPARIGFNYALAYAAGTLGAKAGEVLSIKDLGGLGDGVTDETATFALVDSISDPVYVPWTANFYSVTALVDATRAKLWGPGEIRLSGTITQISSQPPTLSAVKAMSGIINDALAPDANASTTGAVGRGTHYSRGTRTGGVGSYGDWTHEYTVADSIPAAEFDVGHTVWATAKSMGGVGAGFFGGWTGANTPGIGETYVGGGVVAKEFNVGNRWADFGLQSDVGGTRYTVGLQLIPDVVPTTDTLSSTVTMTSGTPGVVNWNTHGLPAGTPLYFGGTGTLPAALTAGTTYYVIAAGLTANAFEVAATPGGTAINFASSSAGTITAIPSFPGSFSLVVGPSVHAHQWWVNTLQRYDTLVAGGYAYQIAGGSASTASVPQAMWRGLGYWVDFFDLSGASLTGKPFKFNYAALGTASYGVPTNVAKISGFTGTAATLAQCGGQIAALINDLKAVGVISA